MPKRNIRKIPDSVRRKLDQIEQREVVAVCARTFPAHELIGGALHHLGVLMMPGELFVPPEALPSAETGKYSRWNVEEQEIVRKDLGLETHTRSVDVPNFGDYSLGTHEQEFSYQKYPRDIVPPRFSRIKMVCDDTSAGRESYTIKFEVDEILDRDGKDFEVRLLACLNLLQENVHANGVGVPDQPMSAYVRTLAVTWELFPPGRRDELRQAVFRGRGEPSADVLRAFHERADFFDTLNPQQVVVGDSGFMRYFGADGARGPCRVRQHGLRERGLHHGRGLGDAFAVVAHPASHRYRGRRLRARRASQGLASQGP